MTATVYIWWRQWKLSWPLRSWWLADIRINRWHANCCTAPHKCVVPSDLHWTEYVDIQKTDACSFNQFICRQEVAFLESRTNVRNVWQRVPYKTFGLEGQFRSNSTEKLVLWASHSILIAQTVGILQGVHGETRNAHRILIWKCYGEYKFNKLLG